MLSRPSASTPHLHTPIPRPTVLLTSAACLLQVAQTGGTCTHTPSPDPVLELADPLHPNLAPISLPARTLARLSQA